MGAPGNIFLRSAGTKKEQKKRRKEGRNNLPYYIRLFIYASRNRLYAIIDEPREGKNESEPRREKEKEEEKKTQ